MQLSDYTGGSLINCCLNLLLAINILFPNIKTEFRIEFVRFSYQIDFVLQQKSVME